MTTLIFDNPFKDGLVYVISNQEKSGTTTVSELAQTKENIVLDIGYVSEPDDFVSSINIDEAQFLYVHRNEIKTPDWVVELSTTRPLIHVNFDSLVYTEREWELMKTNHALLLELEKLLPETSMIRLIRDEIRSRYETEEEGSE